MMKHRLSYRYVSYARAKGRNGWFVPRAAEFEFSRHTDGTPLITLRLYSRRRTAAAPLEIVLALNEWESQALAIQLRANEERRAMIKSEQHIQ